MGEQSTGNTNIMRSLPIPIIFYLLSSLTCAWSFTPVSFQRSSSYHDTVLTQQTPSNARPSYYGVPLQPLRMTDESASKSFRESRIDPETLADMDIVLFTKNSDPTVLHLGAIQEDGSLAPLSAWTREPAFGTSIEFLVDEEDRWLDDLEFDKVNIVSLLGEDVISYGSRQVGGGKGPGNPHGEESELLYYIDNTVIEENSIDIVLKPELEILW
jgi:hypothetical protein